MDNPILSVKNLSVKFEKHKILDDISFTVQKRDNLAIIGPNGAGKSVLFKCLLDLIPHSGEVVWAKDIKIGYVPQKLNLEKDIPLTVLDFLKFKENNKTKIKDLLNLVGFGKDSNGDSHRGEKILKTALGVLSGGEFQRVLIAFALLGNPDVLLFDEPTSGVDIVGEESIYSLIERLKEEKGMTIIFISHELEIVYKYANNVLCLNKEKICYGAPHKAIDKESLEKLYGEEVNIYHHH